MASTYDNDLRLNEMATGDQSGAWGTVTNLNLEMIGDAFGYATEAITTNADTHATVIANGAADAGRAMVLKYTGALDSACTITISGGDASTFTVSKLWYIHNATSGSQNIIITSGSGANITIANGQTKCVYTDGAGAGGAVIDTFAALSVVDLFVDDDLTVTDDLTVGGDIDLEGSIDVNGTTNLDAVDIDGAVQIDATVNVGVDDTGYDVKFFGDTASAYMQWDASADDLILGGAAGLVVPQDKLTIASTAVTSTGAELNQLDAITRGSILYGNASGATARLAKGGANTVLTSDGTDISWAEAGGGGGEQTFTATGAVSNGDIVGLNGDGTISVMTRLAGSFVKINDDGFHYSASVAYDSTNNKIVYLYLDDGNNDYPMVAIGTVSGSSISFGTPVQVASTDGYVGRTRCIFDSNAGKFVAIYTVFGGSNSGSAKCKVGTVSGTSCSFGSEATVQSGNASGEAESYDACYDSGSDKIIFFYITGTRAYINVGDISGTSISWGSRVDVGPAQVRAPRVTYDSSANKVICTYLDVTTTDYTCYYRVCTVSGTSITLGTQGTVANSTSGVAGYSYIDIEYCSARNRLFVAGEFQTVGDVIYVGSLSGTTITFGTPITSPIAFSGGGYITMVDCPDINGVVLQYNYYYNNTFLNLTCAAGTNNPQAFSPKQITGDATTGTATYYYGSSLAYDTTANKVIFATINDTEDDNPTAVVYNPLVPDRWVGLAAEAISNGASGKVTIVGGINTGQSGLVSGVEYKISNSSDTLTTTSGTVVGVATSSSTIYLTKAEIL
jgi:hypothetical protein